MMPCTLLIEERLSGSEGPWAPHLSFKQMPCDRQEILDTISRHCTDREFDPEKITDLLMHLGSYIVGGNFFYHEIRITITKL